MRSLLLVVAAVAACKPTKEQWIDKFVPATAASFCKPGAYFRECFDIDEAGCLALARRTLGACVEQHRSEIPNKPDETSGADAGRTIGSCGGRDYEVELVSQNKRRDNARCNDTANWMP
jgi:hypothetical protein